MQTSGALTDHNWCGHYDFKQIWVCLQRQKTVLFFELVCFHTVVFPLRKAVLLEPTKLTRRRFLRQREKIVSGKSVQNKSWEKSKCVERLAAMWAECSCRGSETLPGLCQPSATLQVLLYLELLMTQYKHEHMLTHMCTLIYKWTD